MNIEKESLLKEKIKTLISMYNHKSNIKQEIGEEFKNRGMNGLRASFIFSGNEDLIALTDSEEDIRFLFIFSLALSKALEKEEHNLILEDYFTKTEIQKWTKYKENNNTKKIYPIVFDDVQLLAENKMWQTTITAQQLNQLDIDNLLVYNPNTQRERKIIKKGETIKETIKVIPKKVEEIKTALINGEQFPDSLTLNVLDLGDGLNPHFDKKNKKLIIEEGLIINIIDGQHRKVANGLALLENANPNFTWSLRITHLSENVAYDYMTQINKQTPINQEYIAQKDYSLKENLIVNVICDDKLSELAKAMKDNDQYIKLDKALTKKSIVANAIKEKYIENKKFEDILKITSNSRTIGRWITEFTDYLMGIYAEEFIVNPYNVKKNSVINHKNMFYGYIALSAKLYNNSNWKEILKQKMNTIDFNKDNQLWKDFGLLNNSDANKALRNKLYELFEGGIDNV